MNCTWTGGYILKLGCEAKNEILSLKIIEAETAIDNFR